MSDWSEKRISVMTWRDLAPLFPEFVQWAAQRQGGLPEGTIQEADYRVLADEFYDAAAPPKSEASEGG